MPSNQEKINSTALKSFFLVNTIQRMTLILFKIMLLESEDPEDLVDQLIAPMKEEFIANYRDKSKDFETELKKSIGRLESFMPKEEIEKILNISAQDEGANFYEQLNEFCIALKALLLED